jgi:putative acyl-CoA dehydrogenase
MSHHATWAGRRGPAPRPLSETLLYLAAQNEIGHICPISTLDAGIRCLDAAGGGSGGRGETRRAEAPGNNWERFMPMLTDPDAATGWWMGMSMTEAQGGSDVGANTTRADVASDGTARINGAKWFTSIPTSELVLLLARPHGAPEGGRGLGLYLHPRDRGGLHIDGLKDKLGTRSLPSAEITYEDAFAWEVAPAGEGLKAMLVMVNTTRLHVATRAVAAARRAFVEAAWHARHRRAFGDLLIDKPLQQAVLADMALEIEAGHVFWMRVARAIDDGDDDLARALTPLLKLAVTKDAIRMCAEGLECLGGNGYVETFPAARCLRDVILQSIWEGTTNVIALDVLRSSERNDAWDALRALIADAPDAITRHMPNAPVAADEFSLRRIAARAARVVQGALLAAATDSQWAVDAWVTARLEDREPLVGALPHALRDGAREYVLARGPQL